MSEICASSRLPKTRCMRAARSTPLDACLRGRDVIPAKAGIRCRAQIQDRNSVSPQVGKLRPYPVRSEPFDGACAGQSEGLRINFAGGSKDSGRMAHGADRHHLIRSHHGIKLSSSGSGPSIGTSNSGSGPSGSITASPSEARAVN